MNLVKAYSVFTLGSALVAAAGTVDVAELKHHPYKVILDRNPFRLRTLPPPISKPPPPNTLMEVKFTGITSDGSSKRAWFVIPPGPGRPEPKSLTLSEGDSAGGLKVVEINEKNATVEILNEGKPVMLNFREYGLKDPIQPATKLYRGIRGAGLFVPKAQGAGSRLNGQMLQQTRALMVQGHPPAAVSRQTNVLTDSLIKPVQARGLPSVKKSTSSLRLPKR